MSYRAWIYIGSVIGGAALITARDVWQFTPVQTAWMPFILLTLLASFAQILVVDAPNHVSYSATPVIVFAALLLLDPAQYVLLVLIYHLVELVKERLVDGVERAWYIQPFNIAIDILTGSVALSVYSLGASYTESLDSVALPLVGAVAALSFVLVNHMLLGVVLILARGKTFRESGMLDVENLLSDWILLLLGHVIAVLWEINPWLIISALTPLVLMYRALTIPQLKQEAQTDSKTGLTNARYFERHFKEALERAERAQRPLAVLMADLDYLRTINNTYGHLAGDTVLEGIGQIIRQTVRANDVAARFGGEEFAIVLPNTDQEEARAFAERIREAIEAARFAIPTRATPIGATISVGLACFPTDGSCMTALTHQADIAVYQAKVQGRNRVLYVGDLPATMRAEGIPQQKGGTGLDEPPRTVDERVPAPTTLVNNQADALLDELPESVGRVLDVHNPCAKRHAITVAYYATVIARALALPEEQIARVQQGALVQDLGKLAIPTQILDKPGKLTPAEYDVIKMHPRIGAALLGTSRELEHLALIVRAHHERWDGTGYPDGLAGDAIPLEARILNLCDSVEAMASDRPYHRSMSIPDIVAELRRGAGTQFDPILVDIFLTQLQRPGFIINESQDIAPGRLMAR